MTVGSPRDEAEGLINFVDGSPSPYHACAEAGAMLSAGGFSEVRARAEWPSDGRHYLISGGTLVAWSIPQSATPEAGVRIVAAHTDSPNLRIRAHPEVDSAGFRQLGVEIYGWVLLNSWLDRDLGLSGRVMYVADGETKCALLKVDRPLLRLPQLAIHLDRKVNDRGLRLNRQTQMVPIWGLLASDPPSFRSFLEGELGVGHDAVRSWDVMAHPLEPSRLSGGNSEFISAPRLDNLGSTFAATRAMVECAGSGGTSPSRTSVLVLFDHEEVGSQSATGANGVLLASVLERVVLGMGGSRGSYLRAMANSFCVSADMCHAVHPNYIDKSEPQHLAAMNQGPAIKLQSAQAYATDANTQAIFEAACDAAGVPWQIHMGRSDVPSGSTVGPMTAAHLGVATVDVGMTQLAMHSARELGGADDPQYFIRALISFLAA
jgi:aspartyl aminopeptidase